MGCKVALIHGHPYPNRSRAGRVLLDHVRELPGLEVRSLYDLYPDFNIDVAAEQESLLAAELIIWQAPFYWYGVPALMSLWFEKVLAHGWAYGEGGRALEGRSVFWVTTTGGPAETYRPGALHGHPFSAFIPAIAQTAAFCHMNWIDPPMILHGAHRLSPEQLHQEARRYRARVEELMNAREELVPALPPVAPSEERHG